MYAFTPIEHNEITAEVGICSTIGPGNFGYGIAAAGCRDYTILQNRIAPNTTFSGNMHVIPKVSPPTPFLRINDGWAEGTFQDGFVEGPVRYLIGVQEGLSKSLQYHAGAVQFTGGNVVELQDVRIELNELGLLVVWDRQTGRVLWSTSSTSQSKPTSDHPVRLTLDRKTGSLRISSGSSILWDPISFIGRCGYTTFTNDPVLVLSDSVPYIQVKDGNSTLYSSQSQWKTFELFADSFIAVSPDSRDGKESSAPPPIPYDARPISLKDALSKLHVTTPAPQSSSSHTMDGSSDTTFLWLDPKTSRLVLHCSRHPRLVEESRVIWQSPNWKTPESDPSNISKATLQG